jgi:hypothetical protein
VGYRQAPLIDPSFPNAAPWYFGSASALYVSLRPSIWAGHIIRAQRLLRDALAAAVKAWARYPRFLVG